MQEIWKDVAEYEGIYQVSNTGKVRSLDRRVYNHFQKGRELKPHNNGNNYLNISLNNGNKKEKHAYIHILVAKAFIPNPNNYEQVNHKDFNKKNNCVENLEWVSRKQNIIHYRKSIYFLEINSRKKQKLQNLTFERIKKYKDDIFKLYKNAYKLVDIAKELNIGRDFVASVIEIYREFL